MIVHRIAHRRDPHRRPLAVRDRLERAVQHDRGKRPRLDAGTQRLRIPRVVAGEDREHQRIGDGDAPARREDHAGVLREDRRARGRQLGERARQAQPLVPRPRREDALAHQRAHLVDDVRAAEEQEAGERALKQARPAVGKTTDQRRGQHRHAEHRREESREIRVGRDREDQARAEVNSEQPVPEDEGARPGQREGEQVPG
jgi:hypothetical protein